MSMPDMGKPGAWRELFAHALTLMAHLERQIRQPRWTFGGGTVLMLRIGHRQSKDIDLFVPDPQYLGYLNPRLSDAAEQITVDYEENAEFIKLFLPTGEIDIVVGTPLTEQPFDVVAYAGREIKVETCAEIIAKKIWHRGPRGKARDLFDLSRWPKPSLRRFGKPPRFLASTGLRSCGNCRNVPAWWRRSSTQSTPSTSDVRLRNAWIRRQTSSNPGCRKAPSKRLQAAEALPSRG